jgi:hypothetical protein
LFKNNIENKVFFNEQSQTPLTLKELIDEANRGEGEFTPSCFPARINGNICNCPDGGEFVLSIIDDIGVIESGKRYMYCRKCGEWSHL